MAFRFLLIHYSFIGLVVRISSGATHIQEKLCQVQVFNIMGNSVKLYQTNFDDLVAGI